jgi:hypothetical protein
MTATPHNRRGFLGRLLSAGWLGALAPVGVSAAAVPQAASSRDDLSVLPGYARAQSYASRKQSSTDPTGGNADRWAIPAGGSHDVFVADGPGVISHIWFTIAAPSANHLHEIVLRAYWDGRDRPSVEVPIGAFFGLSLGSYRTYESAYLACSPGKSLNCYFAMPFRQHARLTVTNEGRQNIDAFYSNIDYLTVPSLPDTALYFHAQYRQSAPGVPTTGDAAQTNPDGRLNHVYLETRGRGHLMGVTLGVLQNADGWWGEGDEMIFVDDERMPAIIGTGSEDYFLGSWNFGGRDGAEPFAHRFYGAPIIVNPERVGGRYCCYRWHGDNPVTFQRYLKHTMEHGHANNRADNFYSVGYWYQAEPATAFPPLPPVDDRIPRVRMA